MRYKQRRLCAGRLLIFLSVAYSQITCINVFQVVQESLAIPGTDLHLLYKTSDTAGYRSVILIQLTPKTVPQNLKLVHLRISIEGDVHTQLFEADANLTYTFSWQRHNAYKQDVYGIVTARGKWVICSNRKLSIATGLFIITVGYL